MSKGFIPEMKNTTNPRYKGSRAYTHKWAGIIPSQDGAEPESTGYDAAALKDIGLKSV